MAIHLTNENIWFDQYKFMDAERDYYSKLALRLLSGDGPVLVAPSAPAGRAKSPLIDQITHASPVVEEAPIPSAEKTEQQADGEASPALEKDTKPALTVEAPVEETPRKKSQSPLIEQIQHARQQIHQSLATPPKAGTPAKVGSGDGGAAVADLTNRLQKLELENAELKQVTNDLKNMVTKLGSRVEQLEKKAAAPAAALPAVVVAPAAPVKAAPPAKKEEESEEEEEDDDDFDMFASDDEEDEEAEKIKQERLAAYAAKKSKKPAVIAKSSVLLDVKPWDDETDMKEMENLVRTIEMDGLLWGQALLKPIGYGINKLTINCVVEDDKISIEELSEKIEAFEDYVQSVDVAAFNKI